ncbi:MAG: tryptophan synthase subunit alpha [Gemmatimonadota bacterium]
MSRPGGVRLETAIRSAAARGEPAVAAFLTAGYPSLDGFSELVRCVAAEVDVVELGVPFSDPMADGITIQDSSRQALANGVTLSWILDLVAGLDSSVPIVLMSYLNPLLARGLDRLAEDASSAGVSGFIVPDLPFDEAGPMRDALSARGVALIQLVTPLTPDDRRTRIAAASQGFLYAVTRTGTTGGDETDASCGVAEYLRGLRAVSPVPVLAGFGIRTADQVSAIAGSADGVIVGSALVEHLAAGDDPAVFLKGLRNRGE